MMLYTVPNNNMMYGRSRAPFSCLYSLSMFLVLTLVFCFTASASETSPDERLDCLIEPWVISDVGSPVQGVIQKLLVDRGQSVKKGQPLAQLESGVESAEVALAKARADTQNEILSREAELKLIELELSRLQDLYQQNVITTQQRDESMARYEIASASLAQAVENRELLQLELHRTQRQYARRILQSPVDGVVVEQLAVSGEFVYDNPVMTVASLDPLRVEVMLPARLFGTIVAGDPAQVFPELDSENILGATVDVVDAMLDSHSGTFGVRLKLSNPDHKIPAGQHCRIQFGPTPAAAHPDDENSTEQVAPESSAG